MSNYLGLDDREPTPVEITTEQKIALIQSIRKVAPYDRQPVDQYGVYITKFLHPDGFVTVHIPVPSTTPNDEDHVSTRIQVIKHEPEETELNATIVHLTSYSLSEATLTTEFTTDVRSYDTTTRDELLPIGTLDPKTATHAELHERLDAYTFDREVNATVITEQHLKALNELLGNMTPDMIF